MDQCHSFKAPDEDVEVAHLMNYMTISISKYQGLTSTIGQPHIPPLEKKLVDITG